MKKLLIIFFYIPFIGFGQSFINTYGNFNWGSSVQQTMDGGYVLFSTRYNPNDSVEVELFKTDINGNYQWNRVSAGVYNQSSGGHESLFQTADGGFITLSSEAPWVYPSTLSRLRLTRRDNNGNQMWIKEFDADSCGCDPLNFDVTNDGGYVIYANINCTNLTSSSNSYLWVIRTDNLGNVLWQKTYNEQQLLLASSPFGGGYGTGVPFGGARSDIEQTSDGGYILCGTTVGFLPTPPYYNIRSTLAKLDSQGNIDWINSYPTNQYTMGLSVEQTTDGGYIFTSNVIGDSTFTISPEVIKTDNSGNQLWSCPIITTGLGSTLGLRSLMDVKQTSDGGYIVLSNAVLDTVGVEVYEIMFSKIDANGNQIWSTIIPDYMGNSLYAGSNVEQTSDGGYVCSGVLFDAFWSIQKALLIKISANGSITSISNFTTEGKQKNLIKINDILGKETKEKKNTPLFYIYDDGTVEKRITID